MPYKRRRISKDPDSNQDNSQGYQVSSKAATDSNRLFHKSAAKAQGAKQITKVIVKVEQPTQDCLTGCFSALAKLFKPGS